MAHHVLISQANTQQRLCGATINKSGEDQRRFRKLLKGKGAPLPRIQGSWGAFSLFTGKGEWSDEKDRVHHQTVQT
jgi:hypothetical protein